MWSLSLTPILIATCSRFLGLGLVNSRSRLARIWLLVHIAPTPSAPLALRNRLGSTRLWIGLRRLRSWLTWLWFIAGIAAIIGRSGLPTWTVPGNFNRLLSA